MSQGPYGSGVSWREKGTRSWGLVYAAEKLVVDLTSPKRKKKIIKTEPVKPAAPKVAMTVAERIVQRKGSVVPHVSGFVSKRASRAKSSLVSERLVIVKSGNMDSTTKMTHEPASLSAATKSFTKKGKSARMGSYEKSTES